MVFTLFAVNLMESWLCGKRALPVIIAQGKSATVNVGSIQARDAAWCLLGAAAKDRGREGSPPRARLRPEAGCWPLIAFDRGLW